MALTNSQYESVMRDYERIRDNSRHLQETRKQEIYEKIPEYLRLEDSVSTLSVSAAKEMLMGDPQAYDRLHDTLSRIRSRQRALLTENGFPADYPEPVFRCSLCQDTGYLTDADQKKQKCVCFRQREISILYSQSHIQDMIDQENFSTLSREYYQGEDLQRFDAAVELCLRFVKNFNQDYHNILFYGTVGTGKSFLSGCIAKELIDSGHSVIYFSSSGLFDRLARYSFDYKEKEKLQDFCEDIYGCDLLIIDDLGTEVTNSFVASRLFSCLNERSLRKRPVIISTNLSLEELRDRYSDRIFSRITSSFSLCKLTGQDIRIRKRTAQLKNAKKEK